MKTILFIISFLISYAFCAESSFLNGLERTFEEAEQKIVDVYVTIPPEEVENLISVAQISLSNVQNGNSGKNKDFLYEGAKIVIKWNGKEKVYEDSNFKTGGMYARSNDKVGYNIKLQKKFLGRKNIRLRPDAGDRSHLRSKLCCDIANRLGLPSIQAVYARLYMNEEYWGLYTLMDAIKPSWIKQTFKPEAEEVTTLIQCKTGGFNFSPYSYNQCNNANDEVTDITEFKKFVTEMNKFTSIKQMDEVMDVDNFLKYIAMEWLIGSFDHFLIYGHNFYFYKRETDNKWLLIEHDYDNTFGNGISLSLWSRKGNNQDGSGNTRGDKPIYYTFADWEMNIPIIKILVHKNKTRFKRIVREVLVSAFNPLMLNAHIDELSQFLLPYIEEDSTPGEDGYLPGRINKEGVKQSSSVNEFKNNIENSLKYWINTKFEVACDNYKFNKTEILNEAANYVPTGFNYEYGKPTPEEIERMKEEERKQKLKEEYLKLKEKFLKKKKKHPRKPNMRKKDQFIDKKKKTSRK